MCEKCETKKGFKKHFFRCPYCWKFIDEFSFNPENKHLQHIEKCKNCGKEIGKPDRDIKNIIHW